MAVVNPPLSESEWDETICLAIGRRNSQSFDRCYCNIVKALGGGFGLRNLKKGGQGSTALMYSRRCRGGHCNVCVKFDFNYASLYTINDSVQ